ncbi:hypothetical protein [Anabaena sp. CA = ATCC 33047]|uniref:hypothetical protein n=1 Tax=Anabaena sp. (strain CA / ATCC 33047) TaxID=52271 RepID=UPI0012ED19E7|nr:hypothetical protein [Anabaena sp. CA = ATCC 33047]
MIVKIAYENSDKHTRNKAGIGHLLVEEYFNFVKKISKPQTRDLLDRITSLKIDVII